MAISYVTTYAGVVGGGAVVMITPAGAQAGDLILALLATHDGVVSVSGTNVVARGSGASSTGTSASLDAYTADGPSITIESVDAGATDGDGNPIYSSADVTLMVFRGAAWSANTTPRDRDLGTGPSLVTGTTEGITVPANGAMVALTNCGAANVVGASFSVTGGPINTVVGTGQNRNIYGLGLSAGAKAGVSFSWGVNARGPTGELEWEVVFALAEAAASVPATVPMPAVTAAASVSLVAVSGSSVAALPAFSATVAVASISVGTASACWRGPIHPSCLPRSTPWPRLARRTPALRWRRLIHAPR